MSLKIFQREIRCFLLCVPADLRKAPLHNLGVFDFLCVSYFGSRKHRAAGTPGPSPLSNNGAKSIIIKFISLLLFLACEMFIAPKYSIRVPHPRAGKVVRIESERQIYYTGAWAKDAKLAGLAPDSNRL